MNSSNGLKILQKHEIFSKIRFGRIQYAFHQLLFSFNDFFGVIDPNPMDVNFVTAILNSLNSGFRNLYC